MAQFQLDNYTFDAPMGKIVCHSIELVELDRLVYIYDDTQGRYLHHKDPIYNTFPVQVYGKEIHLNTRFIQRVTGYKVASTDRLMIGYEFPGGTEGTPNTDGVTAGNFATGMLMMAAKMEAVRVSTDAVQAALRELILPQFTSVAVNNFPPTQPISGSVQVTNFPAQAPIQVSNFPASQPVTGTVQVSNFPATQAVTEARKSGQFFSINSATAASGILRNSPGRVTFLDLFNSTTAVTFISLYNKPTVPVAADVPVATFGVAAGNSRSIPVADGIEFATGISYALTSVNRLLGATLTLITGNGLSVNLRHEAL